MMPLIANSAAFLVLVPPLIADSAAFLLLLSALIADSSVFLLLMPPSDCPFTCLVAASARVLLTLSHNFRCFWLYFAIFC